jgi:hypothetical protein
MWPPARSAVGSLRGRPRRASPTRDELHCDRARGRPRVPREGGPTEHVPGTAGAEPLPCRHAPPEFGGSARRHETRKRVDFRRREARAVETDVRVRATLISIFGIRFVAAGPGGRDKQNGKPSRMTSRRQQEGHGFHHSSSKAIVARMCSSSAKNPSRYSGFRQSSSNFMFFSCSSILSSAVSPSYPL